MKINFNYKSTAAWSTLATAVISAIVGILTALGVTVHPSDTATITGLVTAVLSLLTTVGVLYAPTDAPDDKKGATPDEIKK